MKKNSTLILFASVAFIVAIGNQVFERPQLQAVENETKPMQEKVVPMLYANDVASQAAEGANESVDYALPYPGILPNHPLYFLKELRDRIIETLVVDPVRKSEFYLLQGDKWLSSGLMFLEKNDSAQAKMIIEKSADRMQQVVTLLSGEVSKNKPIPSGALDKFEKAIQKHLEIVKGLKDQSVDVGNSYETLQSVFQTSTTLR